MKRKGQFGRRRAKARVRHTRKTSFSREETTLRFRQYRGGRMTSQKNDDTAGKPTARIIALGNTHDANMEASVNAEDIIRKADKLNSIIKRNIGPQFSRKTLNEIFSLLAK